MCPKLWRQTCFGGCNLAKVFVSSVVAQRGDGVVGAQAVEGLSVGAVVVEHVDPNRHVHGGVVQGELTGDGQHGLRCFLFLILCLQVGPLLGVG